MKKLLDNCWSYGGPLMDEDRKAIMKFINDPTRENWEEAGGIIINPNTGLGISVKDALVGLHVLYHEMPMYSPAEVPDPLTVARAIRYATTKFEKKGRKKKDEPGSDH